MTPITRPNGKAYRPQKIIACAVTDDGELSGVVVLGTHDPGLAQGLADGYVIWQLGAGYRASDPVAVWWRDGFSCGQRMWVEDKDRGRAGVWFSKITEKA